MTLTEAAGGSATVEIAERVFTLNPISNREEGLLGVQWETIAVADVKRQDAETMAFIDSCPSAEGRKAMYQTLAEKKIAREPPFQLRHLLRGETITGRDCGGTVRTDAEDSPGPAVGRLPGDSQPAQRSRSVRRRAGSVEEDQPKRPDPVKLAADIRGYNLKELPQNLFAEHGLTPDDLMTMTPYAFATLFVVADDSEDESLDPGEIRTAEGVKAWNDLYFTKDGKKPFVPAWFLATCKKLLKR